MVLIYILFELYLKVMKTAILVSALKIVVGDLKNDKKLIFAKAGSIIDKYKHLPALQEGSVLVPELTF